MLRTLLLAATALTSAGSILLAAPRAGEVVTRPAWDGAMRVTSETAACGGAFLSDRNDHARFHPTLTQQEFTLQFSSFTRFMPTGTELVWVQGGDNYQFNGEGEYVSWLIAAGQIVFPNFFESSNFTQDPAEVTANTPFVTLVGTLSNYRGIYGCTITLRGIFTRVSPEDVVLPPPYSD